VEPASVHFASPSGEFNHSESFYSNSLASAEERRLITPAKEVMFSPINFCLSVNRITQKQ